ncbi:DNA-formamidopyrimidine glycosylase [Candidatus Kuenenbacteria bacterium]|nr:DNA-formamidopyrimidine glycosylase [Candidatus Kuenenbacteria bacterium]
MPELPEVETIKIELEKIIKGKKIKNIDIKLPKIINVPPAQFKKILIDSNIINIKRRAKILIFELSNGYNLFIHLKLTGQFFYQSTINKQQPTIKKGQVIFNFIDGSKLFYNDFRKFGWLKLMNNKEAEEFLEKENFGPEPLKQEFTLTVFKKILGKKKRSKIKPLLMDQKFIAGIGNIYATEICFYAKINPLRIISTLREKEIDELYKGIKKILSTAIKLKGSSIDIYLDIYGQQGKYISFLKVYDRAGELCLKCKTKIEEITLAGRNTYFCPKCQN